MKEKTLDVDKRIAEYVKWRDVIKKMDEDHEKKRKPLLEIQALLAGWLLEFLKKSGSESVRTEHGTVYSTTRHTASLADPEAFMKFVIANDLFDLLDRRANATAVKDYVAEHKAVPPGCNLNSIVTVGVRRPS